MHRLLELLTSLGNAGAVANAGSLASSRRREDWVIAALRRSTSARPPAVPLRRTA